MPVIFGRRLFGGTDTVPDVMYVQTMFFHIDFLPLCPMRSYLFVRHQQRQQPQVRRSRGIFSSPPSDYLGIEIPLSRKSYAIAWSRALASVGVLVALSFWLTPVVSRNAGGDQQQQQQSTNTAGGDVAFVLFLVTSLVASFLMWHGSTRNASYERAVELCSYLGNLRIPIQCRVDAHFDIHHKRGVVVASAVAVGDDENDVKLLQNGIVDDDDKNDKESTKKENTSPNPNFVYLVTV